MPIAHLLAYRQPARHAHPKSGRGRVLLASGAGLVCHGSFAGESGERFRGRHAQAMLALISGYRHLKPGDTILYCDLDYPAMRHAMKWLRERRGATPVRLTMPEPATHDAVIQTCAQALRDHR